MSTILVVEDEPAVLHLYRDILEEAGFAVIGAATASEAAALWEHTHPDLLIVDSGLPDADGLSLLRSLRRPGVPGILTSGALSPELSATVRQMGFESLGKPTRPVQLIRLVEHLLGLAHPVEP